MLQYIPTDFNYATTIGWWFMIIFYLLNLKKYFNNIFIFIGIVGNLIASEWLKNIPKIIEGQNIVQHTIPLIISLSNFDINDDINIIILYYLLYLVYLKVINVNPIDLYPDFNMISAILLFYIIFLNILKYVLKYK